MSASAWLFLGGCALVVAYCLLIMAVDVFAKWATNREAERTAAATFEADFVPENEDVLAQEHALLQAVLVAELDRAEADWRDHCADVRAWAAEA